MRSNNNNRNPMTNAELISKIKAEIERRITDNTFGAKLELIDILAWLDTLESEKPMNQEGLKEEIESYWKENGPMSHAEYDRLAKCAHHFAQWQKEQYTREMIMSDGSYFQNCYELGKKDMKEQMMKEAVNGWLDEDNEPPYDLNVLCEEKIPFGKFKHGDKVKLIIVKE